MSSSQIETTAQSAQSPDSLSLEREVLAAENPSVLADISSIDRSSEDLPEEHAQRIERDPVQELRDTSTSSRIPASMLARLNSALREYTALSTEISTNPADGRLVPTLRFSFLIPNNLPEGAERAYAWMNMERGTDYINFNYYFNLPLIERNSNLLDLTLANELSDAAYLLERINEVLSLGWPFDVALAAALNETNHSMRESFAYGVDFGLANEAVRASRVDPTSSATERSASLDRYLATLSEEERIQLLGRINSDVISILDEYVSEEDFALITRPDSGDPRALAIEWKNNGLLERYDPSRIPNTISDPFSFEESFTSTQQATFFIGYQDRILSEATSRLEALFGMEGPTVGIEFMNTDESTDIPVIQIDIPPLLPHAPPLLARPPEKP